MKKAALILCIGLIQYCCISCKGKTAKEMSIEEMSEVYKKYTEAIRNGDGKLAMQYASQKTIAYHDSLLHHILYSNEKELRAVDLNHRLWILGMRYRKPIGYWDTMTTEKWFLQMPQYEDNGFYKPDAMLNPKNCNVGDSSGFCTQKIGSNDTGLPVDFLKEHNEWKINIVTIKPGGADGMKERMEITKMTEADYFFYILHTVQKIPMTKESLFEPLKQHSTK